MNGFMKYFFELKLAPNTSLLLSSERIKFPHSLNLKTAIKICQKTLFFLDENVKYFENNPPSVPER